MSAYDTPGVYYERADAGAPGISPIRTDIAGIVGIARCGPLHTPVPLESWRQFTAYFGAFTGAGYLAYAVRAFFENGGRRCWVVRVSSEAAETAGKLLLAVGSLRVWNVAAFSPGVWGNDLDIMLRETHRAQTVTNPPLSIPEYSTVISVTGFQRGTHVRLSQAGIPPTWKVVTSVDAINKRLWWVHEPLAPGLPYDSPMTGFDVNLPVLIESVEYTVIVKELGRTIRQYEGLSLIPEHPRYGPSVLTAPAYPKDSVSRLPAAPEPIILEELRVNEHGIPLPWPEWIKPIESVLIDTKPVMITSAMTIPLEGGADGLSKLAVHDFIGEPVYSHDSDEEKRRKQRGLRSLYETSEVSSVAVPDINIQPVEPQLKLLLPPCIPDPCLPPPPPLPTKPRLPAIGDLPPRFDEREIYQVQAAMIQQCEDRRDRIAILDPPFAAAKDDALGIGAVRAWRSRFDSKYAALYYPWIRVVDPLRSQASLTRPIPPSGYVAGQFALTDFQVGVHKAPANAPLVWAQDVTVPVNDATHGVLNSAGINAIRPLAGRGIRMFGARTVSSDSDWTFLNVRRLLMMIEKAIDLSTQWAVFEPNNHITRAKMRLALSSFLIALWQRGALMGEVAGEAFFVRCDDSNNPPSERDKGMLLAEVGVAPSKPFEFVVLRVGRVDNEFEITESPALSARAV